LSAQPSATNWRGSSEKTGGGSFIQLSLHHTHLLSWILGEQVESVMAYSVNRLCPNIGGDDTTACVCEFSSGVLGVFESAWNADGTELHLYGSEGSVSMHGGQGAALTVQTNRPFAGRVVRTPDNTRCTVPASGTMREQCRPDNPLNQHIAFVRAMQENRAPLVSAETGLYDVAVAKAVYLSATEGRRVQIQEILTV
jgi:predicted dehydrogenase